MSLAKDEDENKFQWKSIQEGLKKAISALKPVRDDIETADEVVAEVLREARLMLDLRHPNVVRLYGVAVAERPVYVALEYLPGGALESFLNKFVGRLSQEMLAKLSLAAAYGVEYLHRKGVIHRDVAARNCLYDKTYLVKISDFGLSRKQPVYKLTQPKKLPLKWMAPESILSYEFTRESDVFSFGNLIYEIYCSHEPHYNCTSGEARTINLNGDLLKFDAEVPSFVDKLRHVFWAFKPEQRGTMTDLVHAFSAGLQQIRQLVQRQQVGVFSVGFRRQNLKSTTSSLQGQHRGHDVSATDERQRQRRAKQQEASLQRTMSSRADVSLISPMEIAPRIRPDERRRRRSRVTEDVIVGPRTVFDKRAEASRGRSQHRSASPARRQRRRQSRPLASCRSPK